MKLTLVCEHNESMDSPEGKAAYPEGLGNYIAGFLREAGYDTTLITIDNTTDGTELTDELLESTDVLLWWGHWYHKFVSDEVAAKVAARVQRGMGYIALHSGHHAKPFLRLIGTTGHLSWREIGERERVWVIDPSHPIARGLGTNFVIPHEEMYGEPFDIPTPDELVFVSWFQGGEVMRSGCVWKRGRGKVFFLRCGHETLPTYRQKEVQTVLKNAIEYIKPYEVVAPYGAPQILDIPEGNIVISK